MKTYAEKLKQHNLKVTPQRLAIYSMLCNTVKHPNAETIYNSLTESHPSMSLATVYKTLDALIKTKLIQGINVGEDCFRYDANSQAHPHIVCDKCHEVYDLPPIPQIPQMEALKASTSAQMDFEIQREQIYFYGVCKSCRN